MLDMPRLPVDCECVFQSSEHRFINVAIEFRSYNARYEAFSTLQKARLFALPGPSEFGKNWSPYQSTFKDRILCLHPSSSVGLPLCTLHDVFRQYCVTVEKSLPRASEAVNLATQTMLIDGRLLFFRGQRQRE